MLKFTTLVLCSTALLLSGTHGTSDEIGSSSATLTSKSTTGSSNITSSNSTPETTTEPTIPSSTTTTAKPTTAPTTTTTAKTTIPPITSTTAKTTTPSNTTPTNKPPTPTTVAPVTTTVPPPVPPPSTGKWVVNSTNGTTTCIIVQMAVQLEVNYTTINKTKETYEIDLPANSSVSGVCGSVEQNLTLSWNPVATVNNELLLHFVQNETTKHYWLHHLEVVLPAAQFKNINTNESLKLAHTRDQFNTGLSSSYRCLKSQSLDLTNGTSNTTAAFFKVSNLQFQAFRGDNSTVFGLAEDCSYDTPDIVPIAVGCALAALVVIVLVAYLVGRRRSQARGYLSM